MSLLYEFEVAVAGTSELSDKLHRAVCFLLESQFRELLSELRAPPKFTDSAIYRSSRGDVRIFASDKLGDPRRIVVIDLANPHGAGIVGVGAMLRGSSYSAVAIDDPARAEQTSIEDGGENIEKRLRALRGLKPKKEPKPSASFLEFVKQDRHRDFLYTAITKQILDPDDHRNDK